MFPDAISRKRSLQLELSKDYGKSIFISCSDSVTTSQIQFTLLLRSDFGIFKMICDIDKVSVINPLQVSFSQVGSLLLHVPNDEPDTRSQVTLQSSVAHPEIS